MDAKTKKCLQRELAALEETYAGTLDWLEQGELHSWVEDGNSPFTNPEQAIHEDGTPFDFIEWHRAAQWVTETIRLAPPSDQEMFDFYTDRKVEFASWKETKKFLRDAQTFLGCEILTLRDFLKEKGLLYEYLRYKDPSYQAQTEPPFM